MAFRCKMCRDFRGAGDLHLCSVCEKRYLGMVQEDRPDLEAAPLEPYGDSDGASAADAFADINAELSKIAPEHFMPLVQEHTTRTQMFPLSTEEALAMQRRYRKVPIEKDGVLLDRLVERMDCFLEDHNFKDSQGNLCAFAKICDVSPKDVLGSTLDDILPKAQQYAEHLELDSSNATLQSLIYAKCTHTPTFMLPGARGILELLCRSERCMGSQGLEMKGFPHNPQPVEITVRDWILMDPAFELRCFINRDKLRGVSQAGCMGVYGIHYPQLLSLSDVIRTSITEFFKELAPKLAPLSSTLMVPGRYVVDLYYDAPNSKWYVVELNPWITSSGGHLFSHDYGSHWEAWDAIDDGHIDLRMQEFTDRNVVQWCPDSWHPYLENSSDVYGCPEGFTPENDYNMGE